MASPARRVVAVTTKHTIDRLAAAILLLEIVTAFSRSPRRHTLVVLGRFDRRDPYHAKVLDAAGPEVLLPGEVYNPETVGALRFHSRLYGHGHTVGGTNPSLVEALGAGNPVLAHDNAYTGGSPGVSSTTFATSMTSRRPSTACSTTTRRSRLSTAARLRHASEFTWERVAGQYEDLLRDFVC